MGRVTVPAAVGGQGRGENVGVVTRILRVDRRQRPELAEEVEDSRQYEGRNDNRHNRLNGAVDVIGKGGHPIEVGVADILWHTEQDGYHSDSQWREQSLSVLHGLPSFIGRYSGSA